MSKILVEMSARHVHLTAEAVEILFGKGATLTEKRELSQPGQYLCEERVELVGPKKSIANVSVLGPTRPENQVEVSLTDARTLGVDAPIRMSGDVAGSGAVVVKGPCGEIELTEGVIAAKRHIHMIPETAEKLGLTDGQTVAVKIESDGRSAILDDTVVRISPKFADAMHIDTDEPNAVALPRGAQGEIIK